MSEPVAAKAAPQSGIFSKLSVVLFLAAVVGGECLVAFLFIPSAAEVAAAANPKAAEDHGGHKDKAKGHDEKGAGDKHAGHHGPEDELADDEMKLKEVDLTTFNVTASNPTANVAWRVDFQLFGLVHEDEEAEFTERYEKNKNRIRDQVCAIVRSADVHDLSDPSLGLIKRKISTKVNEILGRPLVRRVVFSEFSFYEQ
jgi:flagellar basal body-associated protein FliL